MPGMDTGRSVQQTLLAQAPAAAVLTRQRFDAVLFDMDGVVTKTAAVHTIAWTKTFNEFLRHKFGDNFKPFTQEDYLKYVDGKSREEGIRSFLASRNVQLPAGNPADAEGFSSVHALGKIKNRRFLQSLRDNGVETYETTVALIRKLQQHEFKIAVITASKNGEAVLQAANLAHVFSVKIDGVQAQELNLKSKPHPDTFLAAARQLDVSPARAVVIEDASAGVQAGHEGKFGLVIGVARSNNFDALKQHGADVVVADLAEVDVPGASRLAPGMALAEMKVSEKNWELRYEEFIPEQEGGREALCALGNGYFCTRGAAPESKRDGVHYPGTYLAGGYNRLLSEMEGKSWQREEIVNFPNWLYTTFTVDGGEPFDLSKVELMDYEQRLNLRQGILYRQFRWEDAQGRITSLSQRWFVHMRNYHLAGLETTLIAENWSGKLCFESGIDGRVLNLGVRIDPRLNVRHLEPAGSHVEQLTVELEMVTTQSQLRVAQAAKHRLLLNGDAVHPEIQNIVEPDYAAQRLQVDVSKGDSITLEKVVSVHSSRDWAVSQARTASRQSVEEAPAIAVLFDEQIQAWLTLWHQFDLFMETSEQYSKMLPSLILHLNSFHALQTASPHLGDLDCGVPARGWTGEGYEGHVFWDDLFIFPFINLRMPQITRSLLQYRYRRLGEARKLAAGMGARGARFPWQSGSDGREETPTYLWIPDKQIWIEDHSHLQIHVNAAIAYNIWQHHQVTSNDFFMRAYGAEMLFEIARFFASIARFNDRKKRYEIKGVVGPDEFHTGYPNSDKPGIDNNAYTNLMAVWTICRALETWRAMPRDRRDDLARFLELDEDELGEWEKVSKRMFVPFTADGIISQFEGYDDLQEFPSLAEGGINAEELNRVLREQNGAPNQYKVSKQADVLMLFYLFSIEELKELFNRLGYTFPRDLMARCIKYYIPRTANNSTLSRVAHGWVLSRLYRDRSWGVLSRLCGNNHHHSEEPVFDFDPFDVFLKALGADVFDSERGTREGIHMASMAGTLDIVQRCYTGIVTRGDVLYLDPLLPDGLINLSFSIHYRDQALSIEITQEKLHVTAHFCDARPIKIGFGNRVYPLNAGESKSFRLKEKKAS